VRNSFDAVSPELLDEPESKSIILETAITCGAFVNLVDALNRNADVSLIVLKLLAQLRHVRGSREIVDRWTSGMRKSRVSAPVLVPEPAEESEQFDEGRLPTALDRALEEVQRRKSRSREGSSADLPGIHREISWIGARLKQGDAVSAEQALATLIERQGRRSRTEDIVKTLTAVADLARNAKLFDFTLRALTGIERIGNVDAAAACVRAETLRDLGRYEEALAAFEDTMRRFPQNEVAPNARAETLRDLGRYEEALEAFEDTMRRFPQDKVAPNARAETLRDLGRYEEALEAFEDTMRRFPQDEVAPNARAETLRDLGRYEEALAAFEDTMRRFPHNEITRRAYAHLLGSRGSIAEVEKLLAPAVARLRTSGDRVAAHILAMARLRAGRVDEALADIERAAQSCISGEQRRYFQTARTLALLAKRQAAEAAQQLAILAEISILPREEKTNIVLFQAHALAEAGESGRARDIVESAQIVDLAAARQRKLADAIIERYGLVSGVPASPVRAEELSGTISALEFDLVRPKLWNFRANALRAA
jgi:tetratricopeptide (TPR) repeat protein